MIQFQPDDHSKVPPSSPFHNNAIFFIDVEKIRPNPYQPRQEFDQIKLNDLSDSIRMYGVLQPLVVTRREVLKPDGGLVVEYELIAGERRLRASKLAGLREVPVLIRAQDDDARTKLELAIIENIQREDLNAVDRARAFQKLAEDFGFKHTDIAKKVGKSREYVSNSMRILALPEEILRALSDGQISEGHTRPLLMLVDRPEERNTLFKEIILKRMSVRDAEKISRKIAYDRVRKKNRMFDPSILELEQEVGDLLGTRVHIEKRDVGGRIQIEYFTNEDLQEILQMLRSRREFIRMNESQMGLNQDQMSQIESATPLEQVVQTDINNPEEVISSVEPAMEVSTTEVAPEVVAKVFEISPEQMEEATVAIDDSTAEDLKDSDEDLYSVRNFNI